MSLKVIFLLISLDFAKKTTKKKHVLEAQKNSKIPKYDLRVFAPTEAEAAARQPKGKVQWEQMEGLQDGVEVIM